MVRRSARDKNQTGQYMQRAKIIKHAEITIDSKALCTHCRPMVIEFIIVLCAKKNVDKKVWSIHR